MARGKDRAQWWHTAALMALIANCNRNEKKRARPYSPREFHPDTCAKSTNTPIDKSTMGILVGAFVSPEKARAAEARSKAEQALARQLADKQRTRLRMVAA